jgi:hypothetical protein
MHVCVCMCVCVCVCVCVASRGLFSDEAGVTMVCACACACAWVSVCVCVASRGLFSDEAGVLSEGLMALLQPSNERQLRQYLVDKCPLTLPGMSVFIC